MTSTRKFAKSTVFYFLGNVLSKVIVFFLLPLYTKYIPAQDMGYYDAALAIVTFFSSVLFLDIGSGIMRFMFEKKELEDKKYPIYSGTAIFLISLTFYIGIAIIAGFIFSFQYFFWIVLYGLMLCLNTLYGYIARGYGANSLYAVSGVAATAVTVGCNLIFILKFGWDYKTLYISHCIGMAVNIIILEFKCKLIYNFSKKYFDRELFVRLLKFSLPLCINSVAFWFLTSANKLIVSTMLDPAQNGYLAIASKFTSILYLVSSCFQLAWQELAYSKENNTEQSSTGIFYTKAFDLYLKIMFIGLLMSIPLIKLVFPLFVNSSYNASLPLIPLAMLGTIMTILSAFLGSIFGGIKKTGIIFVTTLSGAIVDIVVIFALIGRVGVMSANIALLAGFTVNVLLRLFVLNRIIGMRVNIINIIFYILLFIGNYTVFMYLGWKYNLICFFFVVIIGMIILRKELTEILRNFLKSTKNA